MKKNAILWINERLFFISTYCDLEDKENKKIYDILTYLKKVLENLEV